MAQLVNIRLTRADASPWGFRLQGGKDFGQPLLIQKVNGGSAAERAGLQVGDALVNVNGVDVQDLRHKDAQDTIVRAGNNIDMSVQRGGASVWKPQVTAVGAIPSPGSNSSLPVTKTSLAAKPSSAQIPSGHNVSPRPFGGASTPQLNGGDVKALVNKQYNSPIGVYSEENIAETLSAQTEVLKTGALGVNFMKNERSYDSQKSEVFKMVQEVEHEPREPEPAPLSNAKYFSTTSHAVGGRATSPRPLTPMARQMGTPEPSPSLPQDKPYMPPASPVPGSPVCSECGKHIVGVFVRIKEKNLHVECFKCATCGSSLKNVGYYTINNKLYCDIHAKMVARQNPPAPNLEPVTVPPGGRVPSGVVSSPAPPAPFPSSFSSQPPKVARLPSSGPAPAPVSLPVSFPPSLPSLGPQSPQPGTIAPLPFHTPSAPAPKPFGSVSAPAPAPFTPSAPQPNISAPKPQTDNLNPIIWPPIQKKMSVVEREKKVSIVEPENRETREKREVYEGCKKMSICSQEVCKWSEKCQRETGSLCSQSEDNRPTSPIPERELEMIVRRNVMAAAQSHEVHKSKRTTSTSVSKMSTAEHVCAQSLATQMALLGSRGLSPRLDTQDPLDISSRPHDVKSLLPPACVVRPMSPTQTVVFPPNLPEVMESRSRSPSPCPRRQKSNLKKTSDQQSGTVVWVDQSGGDSAGFPPSFVGLPEVKPGPLIECRVEELKSPRQVPTVEVTHEPDQGVEHLASQDDQTHQATQQYSRVVTEIREIQEESRLSDIASAVRSVQWDEHVKPATPKPQEEPLEEKLYTKNEVEKIIKEELTKVFLNQEEPPKKERPPEISINDLPKPKYASGGMAEALSTASDRPFTPAPFPKVPELSLRPNEPKEPKKKTKPLEKYVPCPEPSEPYFPPTPPPPDSEKKDERIARALREVGCRSPMTEALTTAPERAYSPLPTTAKMDVSKIPQLNVEPAKDVSTPIKSVKPPIRIESAFRPTGNGNGSLVPKSTPLVYIPHAQQAKREVSMEERYGIDRQEVAQGGRTKQMVAGYELASTVPEVAEIDKSQLTKETNVEYRCAVARNPPPQSTQQTPQRAATSGLRADHLLPCYQQFLGDIPTRLNRATSPVPPHQIKAPSMEPRLLPATPNLTNRPKTPSYYTSSSCWNTNTGESTKKAKEIICAYNTTAASQEASCKQSKTVSETSSTTTCGKVHKVSSRTSRNVSPLAGKPATVTSSGKQTFKPDIPARSLSPAWKADYVRSVQNLSPLTVRLPSPVPPAPLPPKGEKTQTTTANVIVKNKSKTTSAKLPKHTTSIQSSKPGQNMGSCGTSQGCGTPPSSGRSTPTHCGTAQGCGTPPPGEQKGSKHCGTSQGCGTPPPSEQKGSRHCGTSEGCGTPPRCPSPRKGLSKADAKNVSSQMIENKENITITNMQRSHEMSSMSSFGKTTSTSAFASLLKKDEMAIQRNNLAGILKTATDTKSKRAPFQTSSSNISWIPYPTNLPLPRDCGVNPSSSGPNAGGAGGLGGGRSSIAGATAPRRGRGVLNAAVPAGGRVPLCGHCNNQIRGPFITALGKIWCPEHFICVNPKCKRPLQDIGFVEEDDGLYCEYCFEQYLAPSCDKCRSKIKGDCLNAIGKHFHPECFKCSYCEKLFGNNPFFLEDGLPYCENDWNELFTTKCFSCGFPIEAGDRWVEALNNNYHSQCFNCTMCKKNLEGQSFFAKGGRPFCKNHAR